MNARAPKGMPTDDGSHVALRRRSSRTPMLVLALCLVALSAPVRVEAQPSARRGASETRRARARLVGIGLTGALAGFVAHELGHVGANLMLGNVPRFQGLLVGGFVPFFTIAPRIDCYDGERCTKHNGDEFKPGRPGKYFIVTAGYHVQHLTNELILSLAPELRYEEAPFRKGMLLFNVFLSVFYSVGAWTGLEDPHGDLVGASRLSGYNEIALTAALLAPAALDTYRYFVPSSRWAPWVSRGSKALFLGLNFTF